MKNKLTVFSSKVLPPRDDIRVEFTGTNLTNEAEKGLERLARVTYQKRESGKGKTKETMEESPSMTSFVLISRKQREALKL